MSFIKCHQLILYHSALDVIKCVDVRVCVLDEERPVALGQCSYVSKEVSRRPNFLHL